MSAPLVILVPTDGSESAARALAFALVLAQASPGARIELLNVQPGVHRAVSMFVSKSDVDDYHREEGDKALAPALAAVNAAGVAHGHHIGVGSPGPIIAAFARHLGCTQVVMGSRGLGGALGLLMGSVATATIEHTDVPVTLVK